jgi:hypothetical protein
MMFRTGRLPYTGGVAGMVLLLITTTVLKQLGISMGEALYLAVLGLTVVSYSITAWRLRQEG